MKGVASSIVLGVGLIMVCAVLFIIALPILVLCVVSDAWGWDD